MRKVKSKVISAIKSLNYSFFCKCRHNICDLEFKFSILDFRSWRQLGPFPQWEATWATDTGRQLGQWTSAGNNIFRGERRMIREGEGG